MTKRTDQLDCGDRVQLPGGLVRTVAKVVPNGYLNFRRKPLFDVLFQESKAGDMAHAFELWEVVS